MIALALHAGGIGAACYVINQPVVREIELASVISSDVRKLPSQQLDPDESMSEAAWPTTEQAASPQFPAPPEVYLPEAEPEPKPEPEPPKTEIKPTETTLNEPSRESWSPLRSRTPDEPSSNPPEESPTPSPTDTETSPSKQPVKESNTQREPSPRGEPGVIENPEVAPRILSPDWPRVVRKRFSGSVLVDVTVGANGKATEVKLIEGTGRDDWDEDLIEVFEEASYAPGLLMGMPVPCRHRFRVTFRQD